MNVASIASPPAEIETGGASTNANPTTSTGTSVDFATVLAGLLGAKASGLPAGTLDASSTAETGLATAMLGEAVATTEDAPEEGTQDDETKAPALTSDPDVPQLAAALVTTTPLPLVTLKPAPAPETLAAAGAPSVDAVKTSAAPAAAPTTPTIPATTVEVEAPPTTSAAPPTAVAGDESALDTRTPRVEAQNVLSTSIDTESPVPTLGFAGDLATRAGSSATYTVAPNPARVEAARAQPASEAPVAKVETAPITDAPPSTPVSSVAVPTATTPGRESNTTVAVPLAPTVVVPPTVTGSKPAPIASPTADTAATAPAASLVAAEMPELPASTTAGQQHGGESSQRETPHGQAAKAAAPVAVPSPALEPHAVVLAKNALNEQVRGASARELLAGARAVEATSEQPAERPVEVTNNTTVLTQPEALARLPQRAGSEPITAFQSTMPSLGEDLVKHVTAHSNAGERTLTLRLTPESLGEVQVEIRSTAGELSVRLISQDDGVRSTLEQHVVGLRESLAKDGRETRIEVGAHLTSNFGQAHDGAQLGRQTAQQDAQERPRFVPTALYGDVPRQDVDPNPAERRSNLHVGVLNLFA